MTDTPAASGMVDCLAGQGWTTSDEEIAFAHAYLSDGPMDAMRMARFRDPSRVAARERIRADRLQRDWAGLGRYRDENAGIAGQAVDIVFIGDSITEMWRIADPALFSGGIVNRGISGQTSPQILLRFMADVVALKPRAVHLMCGVNDIAGNTGPTTFDDFRRTILAMVTLAQAHSIQVILATLTPVTSFVWAPDVQHPGARVRDVNAWLAGLARERRLVLADYHAVLSTEDGYMQPHLTRDGVHPVALGYQAMRPVCDRAIALASC